MSFGDERARAHSDPFLDRDDEDEPADDGIELGDLWLTLKENVFRILGIAFAVFLAIALVSGLSHMDFRATGRLYLGDLNDRAESVPVAEPMPLNTRVPADVGGEIEILRSRMLVTQALLAAGLNTRVQQSGTLPPRYWQWLREGRDPARLDMPASEVRATNTLLTNDTGRAESFHIEFITETRYRVFSKGALLGTGTLQEPLELGALRITLERGTQRQPSAGRNYDLTIIPLADALDAAQQALQITVPKSVGSKRPVKVVSLDFTSDSPDLAALFLNRLQDGYLEQRKLWKVEKATAIERFIGAELEDMRDLLEKSEAKLADYKESARIVALDEETRARAKQIAKHEEDRVALRVQVASLKQMDRSFRETPAGAPVGKFMVGETGDTVLLNLASALTRAERDLAALEQGYSPEAPEVRRQRADVSAKRETVSRYVSKRLERAQKELGAVSGVIGEFERRFRDIPEAQWRLGQLAREVAVYRRMYGSLLKRQQQAQIAKGATISKNRVLVAPTPPKLEDSPRLSLWRTYAVLGLLVGIGFVVTRRMTTKRLESEADVRAELGEVPIFARIPRMKGRWRAPLPRIESALGNRQGRFAEAVRGLRTCVGSRSGELPRVVAITSPNPGDGKSTTAFALAALLAREGRRVLVIDADLHRVDHYAFIQKSAGTGFSDLLLSEYTRFDFADVRAGTAPFDVMGPGTAHSADVVSQIAVSSLLRQLRAIYDVVLLDCPSFPLYSDALIIALEADLVLSVMRRRNTLRGAARDHATTLFSAARRYGVVLNDVREGASQGYAPMSASALFAAPKFPGQRPAAS